MLWVQIRTFGQLQVLTRASYFMLLFVPILAGLWPAVRIAINRYNQAVTDSKVALDSATERLELIVSNIDQNNDAPTRIPEIIETLSKKIDLIISDYAPGAIQHSELPSVWALAFTAALSITIAHLLYQALAPELVQKTTLREFVDAELRRYVEYRSEGQLREARYFIDTHSPDRLSDITERESVFREFERKSREDELLKENIVLIEAGAKALYSHVASRNPLSAAACGLHYAIGLIIIIWVIIMQTANVFSAAGWI